MTIEEVLRTVIERLETQGFEYGIGGSFASSAWGQPRQTNDLDLVVSLSETDAPRFVQSFIGEFAIATSALEEALHSKDPHRGFHLMEFDTAFQIDVFLLDETPYARSEFDRRRRIDLFPNVAGWVFSPEDTILRKLQWYELGHQKSDKQWNDVMHILDLQSSNLDEDYLNKWAIQLGLKTLLDEARGEIKAT